MKVGILLIKIKGGKEAILIILNQLLTQVKKVKMN